MSTTDPSPISPLPTSAKRISRGHSCTSCNLRKIKCDGLLPCSACAKSRVECIVRAPTTPRRKARKNVSQQDAHSRLRPGKDQVQTGEANTQLETVSETSGRRPTGIRTSRSDSKSPEPRTDTGKVIFEKGHPRYIDNNLWTELADELQTPNDVIQKSSERNHPHFTDGAYSAGESLLLGRPTPKTLTLNHPQPVQIFKLWQTCLDNVNPLAKLFHAPSVQQLIVAASSDLENITASTESLMFAIYLSAVNSLGDEDCKSMMGEPKTTLFPRYISAAQQALINAEFLKSSNLVVLQAFALFLLSMRQTYDSQTLWALSGLAIRIGQRIGLHRENISRGLSPFEAEIRRRLWWQIIILDRRSAQLCGASVCSDSLLDKETRRPMNVNDSDLHPAMKEPPIEHVGVTEMLFCSVRYEIGEFMQNSKYWETYNGNDQMTNSFSSLTDKDKSIDELEKYLFQKYIKFCDPAISLHILTAYLAKGVACQIRRAVHRPRQCADTGEGLPQGEKDTIFSNSLKMIEIDNLAHADYRLRGYLWHINVFFPFEAFIYILCEINNSIEEKLVDQAWQNIDQSYNHHPELSANTGNALFFAIGNLAIKAWKKRMNRVQNVTKKDQFATPQFILTLQSQRHAKQVQVGQSQPTTDVGLAQNSIGDATEQIYLNVDMNPLEEINSEMNQALTPNYVTMDNIDLMDWEYWQALIEGRELPNLDNNGLQALSHI